MRSFLGVPIFSRDVVYGDLYIAEKEPGHFTEADEELVTLLAAQTAMTIERVQIQQAVVQVDSLLEDPEVDQEIARRARGLMALVIPLVFRDKGVGVMSAFNKDGPDPRFTDDDLRLAEASVPAPRSPFIHQSGWRVKRSTRFSMSRRPNAAGSRASCTTRPAPR